ncbi:MAG: GEVED domain-containing protein [Chitinophagales bacterium]|nr:GEVED domain-containing protein [Chitinophagales bacterium]
MIRTGSPHLFLDRVGTTNQSGIWFTEDNISNGIWFIGKFLNRNLGIFNGNIVSYALYIDNSNNNVGIGTTAPTARLHINGTLRYTNGSEGNGKILTSDFSGNATWTDYVSGVVDATGAVLSGSGFSVSNSGTGVYNVTFATPFASPPSVVVTTEKVPSGSCSGFATPGCAATYLQGCWDDDEINDVVTSGAIININNIGSGCTSPPGAGYQNFSSLVVSQIAGGSFNLTVTSNPTWSKGYRIWVDWNNNGNYEVGESVAASAFTSTTPQTFTITIPPATPAGNYSLRIRSSLACVPAASAGCGAVCSFYGETEDYTLCVLPNVSTTIGFVSNVSTSGFTVNTVTLGDVPINTRFHFHVK